MTVSITDNRTEMWDCNAIGTWAGGSPGALSGFQRYETACLGDLVSTTAIHFDEIISAVGADLSSCMLWVWMKCGNPASLANGGFRIVLSDGTDSRAYYVGGYDAMGFTATGWNCFVLDTDNLPANYAQVLGTGAPTLTAITRTGVGCIQLSKAVGSSNTFFWDRGTYIAHGSPALTVGGGTAIGAGTFAEMVTADLSTSNAYGIIRELASGVYGIQGAIEFGDNGTANSYFKDVDTVVVFEKPPITIGNSIYTLSLVGNSTGYNTFILGNKVGTGDTATGSNGCQIQSAGPGLDIDFDATNFDVVDIYGCKFYNVSQDINLSILVTDEFIGNTVDQCCQVVANQCVIRGCLFSGYTPDTDGALLWNSTINLKNCTFRNNSDLTNDPHGIECPDAGSVYFYSLTFDNNDYDVYFTAASGDLTIYADADTTAPTHETSGTGSVSIVSTRTLTVTCKNTSGIAVEGIRVRIENASTGVLISNGSTNSSGVYTDTTYNYTGDVNVKVITRLKGYKYASAQATITTTGLSVPFTMIRDNAVDLP